MPMTPGSPGLHYEVQGDRGPRVLLVMGLGMPGMIWKPQLDALAPNHQVAFFDNRGTGDSERVSRPFTVQDLAADAVRVLDALGWDSAYVAGVSLGGMISQELALTHPHRVRGLTLIATHAGGPLGLVPTPRGLERFFSALFGPRSGRARAFEELVYPAHFLASADRQKLNARLQALKLKPTPEKTSALQLLAVTRFSSRRRLKQLRVPTQVVRPGVDLLIRPSHSDFLAAQIPNSTLIRFDDAGHGVTFQYGAEVSRAIADHAASVS